MGDGRNLFGCILSLVEGKAQQPSHVQLLSKALFQNGLRKVGGQEHRVDRYGSSWFHKRVQDLFDSRFPVRAYKLFFIKYFFGWIPCVTPYALMLHYKFEVSHMKLGGRTPYLREEFGYKSMAITYLKSLCGCLKGVIWKFVDNHIEFDMTVEAAPPAVEMDRA